MQTNGIPIPKSRSSSYEIFIFNDWGNYQFCYLQASFTDSKLLIPNGKENVASLGHFITLYFVIIKFVWFLKLIKHYLLNFSLGAAILHFKILLQWFSFPFSEFL